MHAIFHRTSYGPFFHKLAGACAVHLTFILLFDILYIVKYSKPRSCNALSKVGCTNVICFERNQKKIKDRDCQTVRMVI